MAKNNNLTDFLTDVADAIRTKKGTTAKINPQDFSSEIASIPTGGGSATTSKSSVNFYDYDGTLLHSYSKDEFLALSALPDLPTREGLTCQGWNYTLAKAKEYVTSYGVLDIGTTYITDDGKTRLYIKIAANGRITVPLYFSQTVANGVTIDWGDGSATQTLTGTGNKNTTHIYASIGDYIITLKVTSGVLDLGNGNSAYSIMGSTTNNGKVYCNMLQKAEIGSSVTSIGNSAFKNCSSLSSIVIPSDVTSIETSVFQNCYSLSSIVIPSNVTSIGNSAFNGCYSLSSIVIPSNVTSIGNTAFNGCYSLSSIVIPSNVTSIENSAFSYCYSLSSINIPEGVTSIGNSAFKNCYSLSSIVIPSNVTSIGNSTFSYCTGMSYYDFRASQSVPTLSNTNAFNNIPSDCNIVVPDSLHSSWTTATNWSTYKSKIVKASNFNR